MYTTALSRVCELPRITRVSCIRREREKGNGMLTKKRTPSRFDLGVVSRRKSLSLRE